MSLTKRPAENITVVSHIITRMGLHFITIRCGNDYGFGCANDKETAYAKALVELEAHRG